MLLPCPLTPAELEAWRVKARRLLRPRLTGAHQSRRKGQSLEFHDYRAYEAGDDIRHVDWAASARHRRHPAELPFRHWLLKNFVAEDDLQLAITIDTGPTLELPEALSKRQVAAWLAEALAQIVRRERDRVVLHRLWAGGRGGAVHELVEREGRLGPEVRAWLEGATPPELADPVPALGGLRRWLKPTAVWVVISDFYFTPEARASELVAAMARAQSAFRWVVAVELDSWPHERRVLGTGSRELGALPTTTAEWQRVEVTESDLDAVQREIAANVAHHRDRLARAGVAYTRWQWPEVETIADPAAQFRAWFKEEDNLRQIFAHDA